MPNYSRVPRTSTYETNDQTNVPHLIVQPDEVFVVETQLASGPWLSSMDASWAPGMTLNNNPCACIAVEGATPGDVLDVTILGIEVGSIGYMALESHDAVLPGLAEEVFGEFLSRTVEIRDDVIFPGQGDGGADASFDWNAWDDAEPR